MFESVIPTVMRYKSYLRDPGAIDFCLMQKIKIIEIGLNDQNNGSVCGFHGGVTGS